MTDPLEGVIDAYLYEGTSMVYKETERRPDLVEKGYTETPIFYRKRSPTDPLQLSETQHD